MLNFCPFYWKRNVLVALISLFALSGFTQVVGGRETGQPTPKEVQAAELSGGAYGGDVNLFTGAYAGTYPLGTVSTPGGLSFTANLSYTSTYSGGDNVPVSSGIPYGEGWNLNLPTISVSSEVYSAYTQSQTTNYHSLTQYGPNNPFDSLLPWSVLHGDLYWFAPTVSIPGVASGKAVFKYMENGGNTAVFVLNEFDSYLELRLNGNSWEVKLSDGTEYTFNTAQRGFRAAANERFYEYHGIDPIDQPNADYTLRSEVSNNILPKGEMVRWYCDRIENPNLPSNQSIRFEYDKFGGFNYFQEYADEYQAILSGALSAYSPSLNSYMALGLHEFTAYREVLLTEVKAIDYFGLAERMELNYQTDHLPGTVNMLRHTNSTVKRKDSLYNYTSVFYQGAYATDPSYAYAPGGGNSGQGYTPDAVTQQQFSNWKRFLHAKSDFLPGTQPPHSVNFISPIDPYQGTYDGTDSYFYHDMTWSSNSLSFNHGYLESPRIDGNGIVPGDVYELRAVVQHSPSVNTGANTPTNLHNDLGFLNLDLNVVTGKYNGYGPAATYNGVSIANKGARDEEVSERVFSTFSNAVKWNVQGHTSSNQIITSNFFSMPNLPNSYQGIHLQIGPANSDNVTRMEESVAQPNILTSAYPNAFNSYPDPLNTRGLSSNFTQALRPSHKVPQNFGMGLPWYQTRHLYNQLTPSTLANDSNSLYRFWYNRDHTSTYHYKNMPTLADNSFVLNAMELVRYSKNPYMLKSVEVYRVNGAYSGRSTDDITLVSRSEMEYDLFKVGILDNQNYGPGDAPQYSSRVKNVFLLKSIRNVPVNSNEANPPLLTASELAEVPTVHFGYDTLLGTTIGGQFHTNATGIVLSEITNHLGGQTRIEYYDFNDPETSIQPQYQGGAAPSPDRGPSVAVQIISPVKTIKTYDGTAWRARSFSYNGHINRNFHPSGLGQNHFFQTNSLNQSYGFQNTTVTLPEVAPGEVNTIAYYHHNSGPLFGRLYQTNYIHNGVLQKREETDYTVSRAYQNGLYRPGFKNFQWGYPYHDFHDQLSDTTLPHVGFTFSRSEGPHFFETPHYISSSDSAYTDSWFVRVTETRSTEYDTDVCVKEAVGVSYTNTLPHSGGQVGEYYEDGLADESAVEIWLVENSPLPDVELLALINTTTPFSDNLLEIGLSAQPNLSDGVLNALIQRANPVSDATLMAILNGLPNDLSDAVLGTLIETASPAAIEGVLLEQISLSGPTWEKVIDRVPRLDDATMAALIADGSGFDLEGWIKVIERDTALGDSTEAALMANAEPYLADTALLLWLNRANPSASDAAVQQVLLASPYAMSAAVDAALDTRPGGLDALVKADIRAAHSAKPSYADWLAGLPPTVASAYANTATTANLQNFFDQLSEGESAAIEADWISNSPLADTLLLALAQHQAPQLEVGTVQNVLMEQAGLADEVLLAVVNKTGLEASEKQAILTHFSPLTFSVINGLNAPEGNLEDGHFQTVLLAQSILPESLLESLADGNYPVSTPVAEAVLSNYGQLSENVLAKAVVRRPSFSPSGLAQMHLSGSYPNESTLLTLVNGQAPASTLEAVLLASPAPLPAAVLAVVLDENSGYSSTTQSRIQASNAGKVDPQSELSVYCNNPNQNTTLGITNVTEYEYYTARYDGWSWCQGYLELMDLPDEDKVELKHEPSWQLYRTKSYSPQQPGAYGQEEYFYFYDLLNRYDRHIEFFPDSSGMIALPDTVSVEYPVVSVNPYWVWDAQRQDSVLKANVVYDLQSPNYILTERIIGPSGDYRWPRVEGMERSQDYGIRGIAFQQRTSSKASGAQEALKRSSYFEYDRRWNDHPEPEMTVIKFSDTTCVWPYGTNDPNAILQQECQPYKFITANHFTNVPYGYVVYYTTLPGQISAYYICPAHLVDDSDPNITIVYANPSLSTDVQVSAGGDVIQYTGDNGVVTQSFLVADGPEQELYELPLSKSLLHRNTTVQVDTVPKPLPQWTDYDHYYSTLMHQGGDLLHFLDDGQLDTNSLQVVRAVYPYDTLQVYTTLERNVYGQVQLEANEVGLKTRYHYARPEYRFYHDTNCYLNSYSATVRPDMGLPQAITVGAGRSDSLRSTYAYNPDFSVSQLTEPNGLSMDYEYDDYGRLFKAYKGGVLVGENRYSQWKNDTTLSFAQRAEENYVETITFTQDGYTTAERSRAYLDPMARAWNIASQVTPNALTDSLNLTMIHSGETVFDAWGRATETYKPFEHAAGGALVDFTPRRVSTNPVSYPVAKSQSRYENDHLGRPLEMAKPGENFGQGGHTVSYHYSMVNYLCMVCELDLSSSTASLLMPQGMIDWRFRRTEVTDEDGKRSIEFTNALGQKVATHQPIGSQQDAVTLYRYDDQGHLTQVINPEKQSSHYRYNLLGWLYEKETVDGGKTKYLYNRSGQVVLEQDANGRQGTTIAGVSDSTRWYRQYVYDAYGRLVVQQRVGESTTLRHFYVGNSGVLAFKDEALNTQSPNANWFHHRFSYGSSLDWLAGVEVSYPGGAGTYPLDTVSLLNFLAFPTLEKAFYYGEAFRIDTTLGIDPQTGYDARILHPNTWNRLLNGRPNLKGRLSHTISYKNDELASNNLYNQRPVQLCHFSYNTDGEVEWKLEAFNPNGITPNARGLLSRISYPEYTTRGQAKKQLVDINNDNVLDMGYRYTYDDRGRLSEVFATFTTSPTTGHKLASYKYNDAYGRIEKTVYHRTCDSYAPGSSSTNMPSSQAVDSIVYTYDVRDRLTRLQSRFLDYKLFYDAQTAWINGQSQNGDQNYNGNINGIRYRFTLGDAANDPGNFGGFTNYWYQYDGLNRLTHANAYVSDLTTSDPLTEQIGDVDYAFDRIGNFTSLHRYKPGTPGNVITEDHWNYHYQSGNNRLLQVQGVGGTTDRNYAYDAAGNLLSDDFRNLTETNYGRANLPFTLEVGVNTTEYLYNSSDMRIFKSSEDNPRDNSLLNPPVNVEYYLRDAGGNEIGIVDLNTGQWTWYAFGRDRFARITPNAGQQPVFYPADLGNTQEVVTGDPIQDQSRTSLINITGQGPSFPELLKVVRIQGGAEQIMSSTEFNTWLAGHPETDYEITQEARLASEHQMMKVTGIESTSYHVPLSSWVASSLSGLQLASTVDTASTFAEPAWNYHTDTLLPEVVFYIKDHLGNTRVTYRPEVNSCGPNPAPEGPAYVASVDFYLQQVVDYYPYGKVLREFQGGVGPEKYKYQGSQEDAELGENLYYTHFRQLDNEVCRWWRIDPKFNYKESPYVSMGNNPVQFVDFLGDTTYVFDKNGLYVGVEDDGKKRVIGQTVDYDENGKRFVTRTFTFNDIDLYRDIIKSPNFGGLDFSFEKTIPNLIAMGAESYDIELEVLRISKSFPRYRAAIYTSTTGNMDYRESVPELRKDRSKLYLINGAAYDRLDAVQFIWGATMQEIGFSLGVSRLGAHVNNHLNGNRQNEETENYDTQTSVLRLDSKADQRAIISGFRYQKKINKQ